MYQVSYKKCKLQFWKFLSPTRGTRTTSTVVRFTALRILRTQVFSYVVDNVLGGKLWPREWLNILKLYPPHLV